MTEKEKYEKMWTFNEYRQRPRILTMVDEFFLLLPEIKSGDTVLDVGCGHGRAAQLMQKRGLHVTGIDIASNCLNEDVVIEFICADMTKPLYLDRQFDWIYSADVFEHYPENGITQVLENIFQRVKKGFYFLIALKPDKYGKLIGQSLHLTVKPSKWWEDLIRPYWPSLSTNHDEKNIIIWGS